MRFLNVVMLLVFALGLLGCANSSQSADDASRNAPSGRNVFLVDQDHKTLLSLGEPSVLLGGAEENWRCLASYDLDVSFILGESRGSLVALSVSGEGECGVFSAADQDEILESGSMPNRCDAGSSSLRIGCLVDLGESACSQLVNDNGPQWHQLAEKVASKMDGLMIVATMDSGAEYQWELVQGE